MLKKLFQSTASNVSFLIVNTVITFVMTPIYLQQLGHYDYGLWEVIVSFVGYLGLLDLGLRPTISRFTAFCADRRDEDKASPQTVFVTSLCLMTLAGVMAAGVVLAWSLTAPGALAPSDTDPARYAFVLQVLALRLLFEFPFFALESTLEGRLWYTTKNNINIAIAIVMSTFLYIYLPHFDPLLLLTAATAAKAFSKLWLFLLMLGTARYGHYRLRPRDFDLRFAREMLTFGTKSFTQSIAGKLTSRADPLIIAATLGPQLVPFYVIPKNLIGRATALNRVLTHALMPAFTRMHSSGEHNSMERYFFLGSKLTLGLSVAIYAGIVVLGDAFIRLWIDAQYAEQARVILYLMVASQVAAGMLPLHNRLLTAMNRHGRLALLYVYRAFFNVALTVALIYPLGLAGAVLATVIANLCFAPLIWRLVFRNVTTKTAMGYMRDTLVPTVACGVLMAGIVYAAQLARPPETWFDLVMLVAVGMVSYPLLFWLIVLGKTERSTLSHLGLRMRYLLSRNYSGAR